MPTSSTSYLAPVVAELMKTWPSNRIVNVVCAGHSVPAGYGATPFVDSFGAYPHGLHFALKERFPFATLNAIVAARGGESSDAGAARFEAEILNHRPDVLTLDYVLNDRRIGLFSAEKAHRAMIEAALNAGARVLLLGPSGDKRAFYDSDEKRKLEAHAAQLEGLAQEYKIGWVDVWSLFDLPDASHLDALMAWPNHPNRRGHALIVAELMKWFPIPPLVS